MLLSQQINAIVQLATLETDLTWLATKLNELASGLPMTFNVLFFANP
jgi:hypothetical protein